MDRESQSSSRHQLIDLITVVFEPELYLLELQARSISLYIDHLRINHGYYTFKGSKEEPLSENAIKVL